MVVGPPIYEWITHNLFVVLAVIGVVAVMGYYLYSNGKRKGRYRQ